jgi:hypothetical protein
MTSTTAAWAETEHPRAAQGTFTDKPQGAPEISLAADPAPRNGPEMTALLESASHQWRETAAEDTDTPELLLIALSLSEQITDRSAVGTNPSLPMAALERLSDDDGAYVRESVARNPKATAEMLAKFLPADPDDVDDWEYDTLDNVSRHANATPAILAELAHERYGMIRSNVGGNPNTDVDVLVALSKEDEEWVRHSVIQNPKTPVEVLERLATDPSLTVKQRLINRRDMPESIYAQLAKDESPQLRTYLAQAYHLPESVRDTLKTDSHSGVINAANRGHWS